MADPRRRHPYQRSGHAFSPGTDLRCLHQLSRPTARSSPDLPRSAISGGYQFRLEVSVPLRRRSSADCRGFGLGRQVVTITIPTSLDCPGPLRVFPASCYGLISLRRGVLVGHCHVTEKGDVRPSSKPSPATSHLVRCDNPLPTSARSREGYGPRIT